QHDSVHPRAVDEYFSHGIVRNYWGGTSSATTHLLDALHYRGSLRVVRREKGIRIYAAREFAPEPADGAEREHRLDALVDVLVRKYAPLPRTSLSGLVSRLRYCVPQWREHLRNALVRATQRLSHARVSDIDWYWPAGERLGSAEIRDEVRLLAPFDPVVWDRRRIELFWEWAYRFEAYTPAAKRKLGYYALPLLWRDRVVGWGNVSVKENRLHWAVGYVDARVEGDRFFKRELDAELNRMRAFLAVELES
ncbi:MAG TPA: crosslink repair DNA glycosylase YcaQ family protein, partial [Bryobacteraceae bacterium]|nr:crosslink repair DNA glycosylase YcaQ family protein [Bryobacteraceae bacterium]